MNKFIRLLDAGLTYLVDQQIKENKKPKKLEKTTCVVTEQNMDVLVIIEHHVLHTVKHYHTNHPGHLEQDFSEKAGIFIQNLRMVPGFIRNQGKTKATYKVFVSYEGLLKTSTSYTMLVKRVKDQTPRLTATIDGLATP